MVTIGPISVAEPPHYNFIALLYLSVYIVFFIFCSVLWVWVRKAAQKTWNLSKRRTHHPLVLPSLHYPPFPLNRQPIRMLQTHQPIKTLQIQPFRTLQTPQPIRMLQSLQIRMLQIPQPIRVLQNPPVIHNNQKRDEEGCCYIVTKILLKLLFVVRLPCWVVTCV